MFTIEQISFPKQELSDLDPFHSMQDHVMESMMKDIVKKRDDVIRAALIKNGFNPNDIEFLKANFERIIIEGDEFEHYYFHYGQPDEIRIISIERNPVPVNDFNNDILSYKINYTQKYY